MIKRKLIFHFFQFVLVFWLTGILPVGCVDDWDEYGENASGRKVILNLKLPVSLVNTPDPESEIKDAHFLAYSIGSGPEGRPIAYQKITGSSSQQIQIPVGKCDIYIVANYPDAKTKLNATTLRKILEGETFHHYEVTAQPFVMLGVYKGATVNHEGKIIYGGNDITQNIILGRIAAKVTLNINSDEAVVIDSVRINNQARASYLMPDKPFAIQEYNNATVKPAAVGNTCSFYLTEYIVNNAHKTKSTYVNVYAHVGASQTKKEYKIYIGDWFGYSKKFHEWDWEGNKTDPSEVVARDGSGKIGINGLNVSRNKHYIFNGTIVGPVNVELDGTVEVKDWEVINIPTDITPTASLVLSETEIIVNAIKDSVPVAYETTLNDITVLLSDENNKNQQNSPRFNYTIDKKNKVVYFNHNPLVTPYTTDAGLPITVKASITASSGTDYVLQKEITLIAYNPISKKKEGTEGREWCYGPGYWPKNWEGYPLDYKNLKGKDPRKTYMDDAPGYILSDGCFAYYENDIKHSQTGQGHWKLPNRNELKRVQKIVTALRASGNNNYEEAVSSWSSSEVTSDFLNSTSAYYIDSSGNEFIGDKAGGRHNFRCVRSTAPVFTVGDKAAYLHVSHDSYDLALGEYPDNLFSTVPIEYSSDQNVDIRLYDADGLELSSLTPDERIDPYFLGYNVASNEELQGNLDDLWFPKTLPVLSNESGGYRIASTTTIPGASIKNKGKFYLFPNVQSLAAIADRLAPYSFLPPQVNRILYSLNGFREFNLIFSAGKNLSKSVRIRVINPVAVNSYKDKVKFLDAIGVSTQYIGYDFIKKTTYPTANFGEGQEMQSKNTAGETINTVLISENETGCAKYFEGAPSDPRTGVGNWYLGKAFPEILVPYVRDRLAINRKSSGLKGETTEGDPKTGSYATAYNDRYWLQYLDMDNLDLSSASQDLTAVYWSSADISYQAIGYRLLTLTPGTYNKSPGQNVPVYVRCTRRLNVDALSLSNQTIRIAKDETIRVLYYTSSPKGISIRSIYRAGQKGALRVYPDPTLGGALNSGQIVISGEKAVTAGAHIANIVVNSVNDDVNQQAVRIIKIIAK